MVLEAADSGQTEVDMKMRLPKPLAAFLFGGH